MKKSVIAVIAVFLMCSVLLSACDTSSSGGEDCTSTIVCISFTKYYTTDYNGTEYSETSGYTDSDAFDNSTYYDTYYSDSTILAATPSPAGTDFAGITGSAVTASATSRTSRNTGGAATTATTSRSGTARPTAASTALATTQAPVIPPSDPIVIVPAAPGRDVHRTDDFVIDYSNRNSGYFTVAYSGSLTRIALWVTAPNGRKYEYDMPNPDRSLKGLPFSEGNGTYTIEFFEGIAGMETMSPRGSFTVDVRLSNANSPFLMSNHYVQYSRNHAIVNEGARLSAGKTEIEKVEAIYNWFVDNIVYDYDLAASVKSGYTPDLARLLRNRKGICFDYASGMAAMLRTQGIPARLETGWANGTFHSWISVYTRSTGWVNGWIQFNGSRWVLMEPTWAAMNGDNNKNFQAFVNNRGNYQTTFMY
jgi:transglutaminase-like putative cysteine protease/predicted small secreted protein